MGDTVYGNPKYYDIAFSFRDIPKEVETIEQCIRDYSKIPVINVLEIASGTSPHMDVLVGRGNVYTGEYR